MHAARVMECIGDTDASVRKDALRWLQNAEPGALSEIKDAVHLLQHSDSTVRRTIRPARRPASSSQRQTVSVIGSSTDHTPYRWKVILQCSQVLIK